MVIAAALSLLRLRFDAGFLVPLSVAYLIGGAAAGAVCGVLLPLGRSYPGAALLGMITCHFVIFPVMLMEYGLPGAWTGMQWMALPFISAALGLPCGLIGRRQLNWLVT